MEVKGDRGGHASSPGTIYVDVMTVLGQIVMAKAEHLADDYAVAVRPAHMRLLEKALAILAAIGVTVLVVEDDSIRAVAAPPATQL